MFFQVYGEHALAQWGMLLVVLIGLILFNEFARRTKAGGIITFFVIPLALTIYFLAIAIGVKDTYLMECGATCFFHKQLVEILCLTR